MGEGGGVAYALKWYINWKVKFDMVNEKFGIWHILLVFALFLGFYFSRGFVYWACQLVFRLSGQSVCSDFLNVCLWDCASINFAKLFFNNFIINSIISNLSSSWKKNSLKTWYDIDQQRYFTVSSKDNEALSYRHRSTLHYTYKH